MTITKLVQEADQIPGRFPGEVARFKINGRMHYLIFREGTGWHYANNVSDRAKAIQQWNNQIQKGVKINGKKLKFGTRLL